MKKGGIYAAICLLAVVPWLTVANARAEVPLDTACDQSPSKCLVARNDVLHTAFEGLALPILTPPASPIVIPDITVRKPVQRTVTYAVTTKGAVTADLATFKTLAAETYAHANGWSRLGVRFAEVASGGDFTLVLSEASEVPNFGFPCDSTYSCRVGRNVIINQDRWQNATDPWNAAGGDLRNYRHMVINHETGHWLGHNHENCKASGAAAPVMQQQSINLQGCKFNPWPLDSEIWSTTLGI